MVFSLSLRERAGVRVVLIFARILSLESAPYSSNRIERSMAFTSLVMEPTEM